MACTRVFIRRRVYRKTLLMPLRSFVFLYQFAACLVRLTWMVSVVKNNCPYSCWFLLWCFQDLFKTACGILGKFSSHYFSVRFVWVQVVHPYCSTNTATAWMNSRFIVSEIILPYDRQLVSSSPHLTNSFIAFSRWMIDIEVCKLVYWFQRLVT